MRILCSILFGDFETLDFFESLACDAVAIDRLSHGVLGVAQFGGNLFKQLAEAEKIGLNDSKGFGDFGGILLDGKRTETHLQAVEQGGKRCRAGDEDSLFPLNFISQTFAANDFGIEAFRREEEDRKIRRNTRSDVLVADVHGEAFDALGELA